jgi:predicted ATP-binding protein involved in virulence
MNITKLSLNHYRGAESLELKLDLHLNVLAGVNGAGKSTVLDAVAIMLSWAVNRIKSANASGRPIPETDITNGYSSAAIEIFCMDEQQEINWKLVKNRKGRSAQNGHSNFSHLSEFTQKLQEKITFENEQANLPLFVYYPVNRAVLDIPLKIRKKHSFDLLSVYDESLTGGANFRTFFEWFREKEDLENQHAKSSADLQLMFETLMNDYFLNPGQSNDYERKVQYYYFRQKFLGILGEGLGTDDSVYLEFSDYMNANYMNAKIISLEEVEKGDEILSRAKEKFISDGQLDVVRAALEKFLPEFSNFRIQRKPLRMEVEKNGKTMTINQLSDGEKCLIALVGDLARRIAIANSTKENSLEGHGIVLIDEIDLHLHPKWQRTVISKLTEVFPNCQFLISTHSPQVINQVRPENLFILDQSEEGIVALHPSSSYGKNAERTLEDLMGLKTTRPDEVFRDLRDIYDSIDRGLLPEATKNIAKLKERIGEDPDLVKAEVLIRRKELIGK